MDTTKDQFNRIRTEWERVAKEPLNLEPIKGAIYALGSELACLRLLNHYKHTVVTGKAAFSYSENLRSFYFRLEL